MQEFTPLQVLLLEICGLCVCVCGQLGGDGLCMGRLDHPQDAR